MGSSNVHQTRDVTPIPALEGGSAGFVTIALLVPTTIPLTAMLYYCLRFASDQTTPTKSSNEGLERFLPPGSTSAYSGGLEVEPEREK